MTATARSKANMRYMKKHLRQYVFRLNHNYDADIIDYLDGLENIQGEIKRLLREEIARQGKAE